MQADREARSRSRRLRQREPSQPMLADASHRQRTVARPGTCDYSGCRRDRPPARRAPGGTRRHATRDHLLIDERASSAGPCRRPMTARRQLDGFQGGPMRARRAFSCQHRQRNAARVASGRSCSTRCQPSAWNIWLIGSSEFTIPKSVPQGRSGELAHRCWRPAAQRNPADTGIVAQRGRGSWVGWDETRFTWRPNARRRPRSSLLPYHSNIPRVGRSGGRMTMAIRSPDRPAGA